MGKSRRTLFYWSARSQFDNLGDALINQVLLQTARNVGQVLVADYNAPAGFLDCVGIEDGERLSTAGESLRASLFKSRLKGEKCVLLLTPGHVFGVGSRGRETVNRVRELAKLACARLIGVRVARLGVSVAPLSRSRLWIERTTSRLTQCYGVREAFSFDYCVQNGFKNLVHCPDLAVGLHWTEETSGPRPWACVFSFREHSPGRLSSGESERWVVRLLASLPEPPTCAVSQVTRDRTFQERIISALQVDGAIEHVVYDGTPESRAAVEAAYRRCRFVVSNRLHALLLGASLGAVPIAVVNPDDRKVAGVMNDLGLASNVFRLDERTAETVTRVDFKTLSLPDVGLIQKARNRLTNLIGELG